MEHTLITIVIPIPVRENNSLQLQVERSLEPFGNVHRFQVLANEEAYERAREELRRSGGRPPEGLRASVLQWRLRATEIIHFMSMNVVSGSKSSPSHLLIEISADGAPSIALSRVAAILAEEMPDLWERLDIPPRNEALERAFAKHRVDVGPGWTRNLGLTFSGVPGMTVTRILAEAALARSILRDFLHGPMREAASPLETLETVRRSLWASGEKWAFFPEPIAAQTFKPRSTWKVFASTAFGLLWPLLVGMLIVSILVHLAFGAGTSPWWGPGVWTFLALALVGLPALAFALRVWLRRAEDREDPPRAVDDKAKIDAVMQQENYGASNHLFGVSVMKRGSLRRVTLRLAFLFIERMARLKFGPGALGDLKTIHFARWVLIPGTDRLVFLSNYSGSWESYLEDFITKAHLGLTGVWSNTEGFPKAKDLFWEGATDGDRFKRWARAQQEPTRVWFSAYPDLTTRRIQLNALIRQGIASATTETEAADWLSCFGSAPRPSSALETADVPSLVFGGLSPFRFGAAFILELESKTATEWLSAVEKNIIYGASLPPGDREALVIAFAATGLRKLGLTERDLATFPVAFQDGMNAEWRARNLGDVGSNAPSEWLWGNSGDGDAILIVYAKEEGLFQDALRRQLTELAKLGHRAVHKVVFSPLAKKDRPPEGSQKENGAEGEEEEEEEEEKEEEKEKEGSDTTRRQPPRFSGQVEPFGFVDGVSQPIIRGTRRWTALRDQNHLVQPGEIVLGYPDNRNKIPPSPSVHSADDPHNLLPPLVERDVSATRPNFSHPQPTAEHDLGRGGTFLVVRQLEQDTEEFRAFVEKAADELEGDPRAPTEREDRREWLMAKLVGRWPDGTSLVRYPNEPGSKRHPRTRPDNDFLYAGDDPDGLRCPFGAHVRRANPRDSLGSGDTAVQLAISNRHRILRIGRTYMRQEGSDRPGLFFMCLNADIERQFEFVQQTWTTSTNFHGLENEVDCFSPAGRTDRFTIPTTHGPLCLPRMADFVSLKGGGYFFLPGRRALRFLASRKTKSAPAALEQKSVA